MSYRGKIKNGVVILEQGAILPEGQCVEVTAIPSDTEHESVETEIAGFGLWRDRTDMNDSAEASLKLRQEIEKRSR